MTGIDTVRLSRLSSPDNLNLKGDELYLISLAISADIDEMTSFIYKDFKLNRSSVTIKSKLTRLGEFAAKGLVLQKTIAEKTGISESKLSTLFLNPKSKPKAYEVYLISHALAYKPVVLFKFVYGHLKLNSIKEQERLRKEYEAKRK